MPSGRFRFTTIVIVGSLALTLVAGARMLCACTTMYPIRWSLDVKITDEIDDTTLKNVEQAVSKLLIGKSLAELSAVAEQARQKTSFADYKNFDEDKDRATTPKDLESFALEQFVYGTSLRFLNVKSTDQVNDKTLTFQEANFSNLLWEDQIVFTLDLDNQIIRHVKVTHNRRFLQVPRNFLASLVN